MLRPDQHPLWPPGGVPVDIGALKGPLCLVKQAKLHFPLTSSMSIEGWANYTPFRIGVKVGRRGRDALAWRWSRPPRRPVRIVCIVVNGMQPRIDAVVLQQLLLVAYLCHPPVVQNHNLVGVPDGRQTVGDDD